MGRFLGGRKKMMLILRDDIDVNNAIELLNKAEAIKPNDKFLTLEALRNFILGGHT
jgi:hypothetical protein